MIATVQSNFISNVDNRRMKESLRVERGGLNVPSCVDIDYQCTWLFENNVLFL